MEETMTHTYKNKTELELVIPDVGTVPASAVFSSSKVIENPNIERVEEQTPEKTEDTA
jgi:hypothetical protein